MLYWMYFKLVMKAIDWLIYIVFIVNLEQI